MQVAGKRFPPPAVPGGSETVPVTRIITLCHTQRSVPCPVLFNAVPCACAPGRLPP